MRHVIEILLSPISWLFLLAIGCAVATLAAHIVGRTHPLKAKKLRIYIRTVAVAGFIWVVFACTPFCAMICAMDMEEMFPPRTLESLPGAAVVVLPADDPHVRDANILNAQQAKHLLKEGKASTIAFLGDAPVTCAVLKDMGISSESFASVPANTTDNIVVVSDAWRMRHVVHATKKLFPQAKIHPFAYGHLAVGRTCRDMRLMDFLPSPQGARMTWLALKGVLEV